MILSALSNITAAQANLVKVLKVESVSAINLSQIKVTFSKDVDKASAETIGNYQLGTTTLVTDNFDATQNANEATARLQDDKKTVIITLALPKAQSTESELKITTVQSAGNTEVVPTTIKPVTFSDTAVPTISSLTVSGNKEVKLTFSEPVKRAEILQSQFKIDGNSLSYYGGATITTVPATGIYVISATITTGNAMPAGDHTLAFDGTTNALTDAAGFPVAKTTQAFSVSSVTTAPTATVISATKGATATVKVQFSAKVDASTLTGNFDVDGTAAVTNAVVDADDKSLVILTVSNLAEGANVLVIQPAVKDAYGNSVSKDLTPNTTPVRVSFTASADTTKPEVVQVLAANVSGVASEQSVRIKFSEAVDTLTAQNTANYTIKNAAGTVVASSTSTTNAITAAPLSAVDGQNVIVTLALTNKLPGGSYTVEVKDVKDGAGNVIVTVAKEFVVVDKTAPTLKDQDTATAGTQAFVRNATDKTITVYFSEPMSVTGEFSILSKANYRIAGQDIADNATITAGANNESAIIQFSTSTLPDADANPANSTTGQVIVVKDASGITGANLTSGIINGSAVTTGPKVVENSVQAFTNDTKDYITFTTDKQLTALEADDFLIYVDGNVQPINPTSYAINGLTVTLNFAKNALTTGTNVTLDVDQTNNATTDATGAKLDTFNGNAMLAKDKIAPVVSSVARSGNNVQVVFNENLDASISGLFKTDWVIDNAGTTVSVKTSSSSGTTLTLTPVDGVTLSATNVKVYPATTVTQTKDAAGNLYVPTTTDKDGRAVADVVYFSGLGALTGGVDGVTQVEASGTLATNVTVAAKALGAYPATSGNGITIKIAASAGATPGAAWTAAKELTITLDTAGTMNAAAINAALLADSLDTAFLASGAGTVVNANSVALTGGVDPITAVKAAKTITVENVPVSNSVLTVGNKKVGFLAGAGTVADADFTIDTTGLSVSGVADAVEALTLAGNVVVKTGAVGSNATIELEAATAGVAGNALTITF